MYYGSATTETQDPFIKFKKEDHLIEFITKSLFDDSHKIKNSIYKDFLKIKQIRECFIDELKTNLSTY
ncbi:hypothetical protein LEP1GSC008_3428 [Leptospira kirschneri serovar Bulgarica str. Nikolaevo]|uniref:Uncharacterized protein n=2 Tax=Leptospira kirschneri TaxID=29507 RepID=A0A0E2B717_9LEPT|nr:hypothetical protein LEP1GSC081_2694 [Leptospira kirschneri str. H1]EMK20584.1 hypothetical protein LEP1GSC008_3428 [Leptospira kirschneri serovar Bulgarica str. Nikolaevo]